VVLVVVVDDVVVERAAPGGDVTPEWLSTTHATTPMTTNRITARGRRRRLLLLRRSATSRARSVLCRAREGTGARSLRCGPVMREMVRGPIAAIEALNPTCRWAPEPSSGVEISDVGPQRVKDDAHLRRQLARAADHMTSRWKSRHVVRTSGSSPLPMGLAGQCASGRPIGRWSMSAP
jgi:hypothetical protein